MTNRRDFLWLLFPSIAVAQVKNETCQARLEQCLERDRHSLERNSAPFYVDGVVRMQVAAASDFEGADAYRLMIADLVHEHFSEWITIDPAAKATLEINGSSIGDSGLQLVSLAFGWNAYQLMTRSDLKPVGVVEGFFRYKSAAYILSGEKSKRVHDLREVAFRLFSDLQAETMRLRQE